MAEVEMEVVSNAPVFEIGVLILTLLLPLLVIFGVTYLAVRLAIRHEHRNHER
jgi:hypothetical protein